MTENGLQFSLRQMKSGWKDSFRHSSFAFLREMVKSSFLDINWDKNHAAGTIVSLFFSIYSDIEKLQEF